MTDREQLESFGELLSYPGPRTVPALERLAAAGWQPVAGELLARTREELQELYTRTFDLEPTCAPYFGHQLFGDDSGRRGALLAALAGIYRREGFAPRDELPDHVAEVLRFLAVARPGAARDELVRDGLLPALRTMIDALDDEANPYREVLVAARVLLVATVAPEADAVAEVAS